MTWRLPEIVSVEFFFSSSQFNAHISFRKQSVVPSSRERLLPDVEEHHMDVDDVASTCSGPFAICHRMDLIIYMPIFEEQGSVV